MSPIEPKAKRRKSSKGKSITDDDIDHDQLATKQLQAYGEQFMSMFEDYEPSTKKSKDRKKSKTSINQAPQGKEPLTSKTSKIKPPLDTKIKPSKKPKDDILAQIFDQKKKISKENPSKLINGSSSIHFKAKEPSALLSMKEERRRFMSHKAAKIVDGPSVVDQGRESSSREKPGVIGRDEGDGLSPEEFKKMQREVLLYGASALDKKSKKKFDAAMLSELGMKAQKGPRIPASIGLGMAKKQAQRQARADAEALAAGMLKPKSKKKEKAPLDKGLFEDRGAFRHGVLKVSGASSMKSSGGRKMKR